MAQNQAYQRAELQVEEARQSRAKKLDLSAEWDEKDSEKLTELPKSLGQLTQLQSLDLSGNQLTALPQSVGQLTKLRFLSLSANGFKVLPQCLTKLTALNDLRLAENRLDQVPDWLGDFTEMKSLTLCLMGLRALPDSLNQLTSLTILDVSGNEITSLPNWLSNFSKLEEIYAQENRLSDIPPGLAELKSLRELALDNNPLNPELAAANEEGFDAVKRYLRANANAQVVLNEAKLILVGEGEVGKSCLLGALRGDQWEEGRLTTHGIEIKSVKMTDSATGTEITLNGWDFGRQRVYRPTHQLFFSAPAVYLVVWKPREGPQQGLVKEWIKLVKHREPDAKILVVATHGGPKERQPDIDRQEIWDLFGKDTVINFFHVESKPPKYNKLNRRRMGTCKGIDELKDAIARVSASLPEVGRTAPKRWHEVREALKETGEAYLSLDRVLAICAEHKMSEEEAQDFIRISHRLGHLIHYGHDPRLKEMVILKPDWLATAVSFVLDDEETRKKHGLVKFTRLGKLWSDKERAPEFRYPAKVHQMFVALMERWLDQNLKRGLSQVQDAFLGLMQTMTDEGKDGPRLFSLEPVERSTFNPNGWVKKKFRVTLWCEHTRLPLPLLNKNGNEGVYEFDVTREWFAAAAPFLKVLVGTLSLVLPVAASATKLALDEATYKGLEKQLDFGKASADAMLNATGKTTEWLSEKEGPDAERSGIIHAQGGVLREFQTWLKKEDPGFGDLRKVLNKQKEFLWVHRDFEKEY